MCWNRSRNCDRYGKNHINNDPEFPAKPIECLLFQTLATHLLVMKDSKRKPTPRQIAFFKFMGVEDVEELFTMEQVGEIFDNGFSEWWFNRYVNGEEQIEWFDQSNSDWFFQRIILYPFLYRPIAKNNFRNSSQKTGTTV